MTIKFERFTDNYMCKDYFYSIWKSNEELDDRHSTMIKVTMIDYDFEQLFKDMAKELGYTIHKNNNDLTLEVLENRIDFLNDCQTAITKKQGENIQKLEDKIKNLEAINMDKEEENRNKIIVYIPFTKKQLEMVISGLGCDLDEDTYIGRLEDDESESEKNKQKTIALQTYLESFLMDFEKQEEKISNILSDNGSDKII